MIAVPARWKRLAYDAGNLPLLGAAVARAYRAYFERARGRVRLFRGLYPSFRAALKDVPAGRLSSYDNADSASRVLDEWLGVYPNDYPVIFWLSRLLRENSFVFDWGGNVGLKYFAYRRYIDYPSDHVWLVAELPAVVELGREIARRESAAALQFTAALDELERADILLAAGVFHFIDDPLEPLRTARRLPRHIILNKVPAYDMPSAVTLQNMGTAVCPYHLFNRAELVAGIEALGYEMVDEWKSPDVACHIPFFPKHSIDAYSGFYFRRVG